MKRILYYGAILATFIIVLLIGVFICVAIRVDGILIKTLIVAAAISAAKVTSKELKGKLNPSQMNADKFHAKYPIVGLDVPVKALEHGDRLKIAGRGDYIYSGKFMGKYVIIPTSGEEAIEITPDEMLRNCKEIRGEYGPKWTAPQQ